MRRFFARGVSAVMVSIAVVGISHAGDAVESGLKPGDFVHDMSIRLTVDHRFTIVDVEAFEQGGRPWSM